MICETGQHNEAFCGDPNQPREVYIELIAHWAPPLFENHSSLREALRASKPSHMLGLGFWV